MTTQFLFKGSLDECHKWAKEKGLDLRNYKVEPTDGSTWTEDGWANKKRPTEYVNGQCQFVVVEK